MTKSDIRFVKCSVHKATDIARVERSSAGEPYVITWLRHPVNTERALGGRRVKPPINEARVFLHDARTDRWLASGIQTTLLTYCTRCNREYELGIEWLREQAKMGPGKVLGPPSSVL